MSGQIFISYRREESRWSARSLHDRLCRDFDLKQIFMDIDAIALGEDFVKAIETTVEKCDVLIAVIGNNWLASKDDRGDRRLDNPEDFVRMEIGTALKREIRVIPVLVDGALMPRSTELPEDLKSLVRRNALRITDTSFDGDCQRLATAIKEVLEKAATEEQERERIRLEAENRDRDEKQRQEVRLKAERARAEDRRRVEASEQARQDRERSGLEKRQLKEKKRGEPSVENAPKNADVLFQCISKYHFIFPVCAMLGYMFALLSSGHVEHPKYFVPPIPILVGLIDHLAQRRWTIFEIIAYWIGALTYGGLAVFRTYQFWSLSGETHHPTVAIILAFSFQFLYAIVATILATRQRRLGADRSDQRFRLLQRWSFVPFALVLIAWLLPSDEHGNFYQEIWRTWQENPGVLIALVGWPVIMLLLHFFSFRWKIYLDVIFSWVGLAIYLAIFSQSTTDIISAIYGFYPGIFFSVCFLFIGSYMKTTILDLRLGLG